MTPQEARAVLLGAALIGALWFALYLYSRMTINN